MPLDIFSEADRLLSLDALGRKREAVVIALRLGQNSETAMDAMSKIDLETLDEFARGTEVEVTG